MVNYGQLMVNYCLWWRYRTSYGVIFSNKDLWGQHLQLGIFWSTTWMGKCLKMLPFNWDWKTQAVIWCYSFLRLAMFSSSLKPLGVVDQRVDLSGKTGWLTRGQVSFWRLSFVNGNTNRPTKSVILSMEVSKSMGVAPNHPISIGVFHNKNHPAIGVPPWLGRVTLVAPGAAMHPEVVPGGPSFSADFVLENGTSRYLQSSQENGWPWLSPGFV